MAPRNKFERFRGFLELIIRFEFEFCRRENYFLKDSSFGVFKVQSHTPCGCTCACAVACLCPHNSISNAVASVSIHDNLQIYIYIYIYIRDVAKHETIVEGHKHMCAFTYIFNQIHIHIYIHIHIHKHIFILLEEGEEGGDKPNHVTTDSRQSFTQYC